MFNKKPEARQNHSMTIQPPDFSPEVEEQPQEDSIVEDREELKPVDKEKEESKPLPKYAYIVACELVDANTISYVIRSNLLLRPGLVKIEEIE